MSAFKYKPILNDLSASEKLLGSDEAEGSDFVHALSTKPCKTRWRLVVLIAAPYLALATLIVYLITLRQSYPTYPARLSQTLYSPAQEALKAEIKIFELGFDDGFHDETTVYQGQPSKELDERWEALYEVGMTKISRQEAAQLPNRTAMLPHQSDDKDNERGYVIMLDVFHQLHCLNVIRKALSPSHYTLSHPGHDGEDELLGFHHVDHCVDSLRQSLMCSVDVTPLVWQWSDERQKYLEKAQVPHTCRNFNAVKEWAANNALKEKFSLYERQFNDPLDRSTWTSRV